MTNPTIVSKFSRPTIRRHERYHELHNHSRHVNGALSNVLHDMVDTCYPGTRLRFVEYQVRREYSPLTEVFTVQVYTGHVHDMKPVVYID